METLEQLEKTSFLCKEFLMWLLYRSETQKGFIGEEKDATLELWCSRKVTFGDTETSYEQLTVTGDEPVATEEAKTALKMGKIVKSANFSCINREQEWEFQITSRLKIKSVKVQSLFKKDDPELLLDRVTQLEDFFAIFDSIFKYFLSLRVDEESWIKEEKGIRRWIFNS